MSDQLAPHEGIWATQLAESSIASKALVKLLADKNSVGNYASHTEMKVIDDNTLSINTSTNGKPELDFTKGILKQSGKFDNMKLSMNFFDQNDAKKDAFSMLMQPDSFNSTAISKRTQYETDNNGKRTLSESLTCRYNDRLESTMCLKVVQSGNQHKSLVLEVTQTPDLKGAITANEYVFKPGAKFSLTNPTDVNAQSLLGVIHTEISPDDDVVRLDVQLQPPRAFKPFPDDERHTMIGMGELPGRT